MCFQYLALTTCSALLFGLLSIFYAGRYNTRYRRVKRSAVVTIRLLLALCVAANSAVEFSTAFWMVKQRPYVVLVAELVSGVSWVSHAVAMWVFSTSVAYKGRGPLLLNSSWYMTLIASILHFRSVIRWTQHHTSYQYVTPSTVYFALVLRITAYVHMGLQILYGLSFLFGVREAQKEGTQLLQQQHGRWRWRNRVVSIQNEDEYEEEEEEEVREKQPLMHSRFNRKRSTYTSLVGSERDDLNVDLSQVNANEDGANPLSLFVFWWVWPLLKRGAMGYLQTPTDLPQLPRSLQTARIREKFRNVLLRKRQTLNVGPAGERGYDGRALSEERRTQSLTVSTSAVVDPKLFLDSEVMLHSFTRSTPLLDSFTPDPPVTDQTSGQSADGTAPLQTTDRKNSKPAASRPTSLLFLFSAINRTFGWHYYPLGLLKLTTDLLGFAGPLLLYQLVDFIENKKVSLLF